MSPRHKIQGCVCFVFRRKFFDFVHSLCGDLRGFSEFMTLGEAQFVDFLDASDSSVHCDERLLGILVDEMNREVIQTQARWGFYEGDV